MGWKKRGDPDDTDEQMARDESPGAAVDAARTATPGGTLVAEKPTAATPAAPGSADAADDDHADDHADADDDAQGRLAVVRHWWLVLLVRAAHPKQALVTALAFGVAALLAGRATREVLVVMATVLVGQSVLGWHNDLVDRERDRRQGVEGKPLRTDHLETGTVWFALVCGALLVVPLSLTSGATAGLAYLAALAIGLIGHRVLRHGVLSWVPWAASFALYPAYLSYGGWGGQALGPPPSITMTVLAALLGVGIHVLLAVYGLVADHEEGWRTLPVRLGLRLGAGRLLALASAWTGVVLLAMALVGISGGLSQ